MRHSHRILAIRDIIRGERRGDVCERYGISRENLRHWVSWYNESGVVRMRAPIDTRYANAYIFGAFCPERDAAVGLILPYVNTDMMQMHLDEISAQLPPNTHAAMLVDGAGWHTTDNLKMPENITLIKIPPSSPELNPAEKPWQFLKDNFLSQLVLNSYEEILDACNHAWNKLVTEQGRVKSLTGFSYLKSALLQKA